MKKLLAFLLCSVMLFGDSSGPRSGTGAGTAWVNPTNVSTSNNAYATYGLDANVLTSTLSISTLGFAIPSGATITGIEASIERKASANSCINTDTTEVAGIWLTKSAGVTQGTNKGSATFWTTIDTTQTLGSSSDLWGSTWTDTEINAAGFGVGLVAWNECATLKTVSVDYMAVTVYYTPSGASSRRRNAIISQTRTIRLHA
jgi:hypothetical protein